MVTLGRFSAIFDKGDNFGDFLALGIQLILAYSWARPAILVAGKGRGGMLIFLLFLHFHSFSSFSPVSLFHLLYYLFSISLGDDTRVDVLLNPNTIKKSCLLSCTVFF